MSNYLKHSYLVIDGENIDATLGMSVLNRRPHPNERPRWDRVLDFSNDLSPQPIKGLFFLNATSGQMPMNFVQALLAMNYHPIPLAGSPDPLSTEKVVDIGIQRMLSELSNHQPGWVLLASHDGDFIPQVEDLLNKGWEVGILCFREFLNAELAQFTDKGMRIYDLEQDVDAFENSLPRTRIIPLEQFDPTRYL